jgi:hypothetical protein
MIDPRTVFLFTHLKKFKLDLFERIARHIRDRAATSFATITRS